MNVLNVMIMTNNGHECFKLNVVPTRPYTI